MKILVTGANGFVGKMLCARLIQEQHEVYAVMKQHFSMETWMLCNKEIIPDVETIYPSSNFHFCYVDDIGANTDWRPYLKDINVVVHLAARTHVMQENAIDVLTQYRAVNVEGTRQLAKQSTMAGVQRFIYLSSIKIHGEETSSHIYSEDDAPSPVDAYGISKLEAEQVLKNIAQTGVMEYVIIRPPLVYGPGVKGNFFRLMQLIKWNIPLPFKKINNKRTMIYVENLVDIINVALTHPKAANQIFLVGENTSLSTPQLIQHIAKYMKKSSKLYSIPDELLHIITKLARKEQYLKRLTGSLEVNIQKTHTLLNWQPTFEADIAFSKTVEWYLRRK